MENTKNGLADAYQLAAHEMRNLQRLAWDDLSAREDAPFVFGSSELRRLANAHGGITIVEAYDGNPSVKRLTVALEWLHSRQGRRSLRLTALVNREAAAAR